jgi:type IV pilus assembly protein PilM
MTPLTKLLSDPPPAYAFELSEAGLSYAKVAPVPQIHFQPFEEGVLSVSPVHDNVHKPDVLTQYIGALLPVNGNRKRRAALILPDYCARVAVLDFDSFPTSHEEQLALVRFRMKKSVPFDVENAVLSFHPQPRPAPTGKIEVLVAVVATEIVLRYETPFRTAGFHPGFVTVSSLPMLNMISSQGLTLVIKGGGHALTAVVLDSGVVKLVRCVEVSALTGDEIESVVLPTMAYIEDELSAKPARVLTSGLGLMGEGMSHQWSQEWGIPVEPLRSRFGAPGPMNAGLLGYLESLS